MGARMNRTPEEKMSILLEAMKNYHHGDYRKVAERHNVSPTVLSRWKKKLESPLSAQLIFGPQRNYLNPVIDNKALIKQNQEMQKKIEKLTVENEKNRNMDRKAS